MNRQTPSKSHTSSQSVAAIVVTYNRVELLCRWIKALEFQTRPVQEIIIVDNASQDGTESVVLQEYPSVTYLRMVDNVGPGGAWAAGMQIAHDHGHDWFWMFGDDAFPEPSALEKLIDYTTILAEDVGIVCPVANANGQSLFGISWTGKVGYRFAPRSDMLQFVDAVTFAGPLISRSVADLIGYPRGDFFFMFEEYEYCLRARRVGFRIAVSPDITVNHVNAGSQSFSPPWRGYYQTRNQLVMALESRSSKEFFWWCVRQVKFAFGTILYLNAKRERLALRALGAWHGVRGRMGRTIDPSVHSRKCVRSTSATALE
jgi:GT2 family glycosyltransferase